MQFTFFFARCCRQQTQHLCIPFMQSPNHSFPAIPLQLTTHHADDYSKCVIQHFTQATNIQGNTSKGTAFLLRHLESAMQNISHLRYSLTVVSNDNPDNLWEGLVRSGARSCAVMICTKASYPTSPDSSGPASDNILLIACLVTLIPKSCRKPPGKMKPGS